MIRDFGSFTRRGLLADLSALWKYGVVKSQREQGGEAGEETVEDRKTTDQPAVIE